MIETILINGLKYPFNNEREDLIDGHVYCKTCGEQLDTKPIKLFGERYIFTKKCLCERKKIEAFERQQRLIQIDSLKKDCFKSPKQWSHSFENFQGEKTNAYITGLNYAKEFKEMKEENVGLLLFGPVGSGKSYLASCIANYLMENEMISVKMRNFSEIINELQTGGFNLDRNKYIDSFTNAPLLILDDLGIERDTSYAKEQVYNVINSRYLKQKPTIITTNLPWKHILNSNESMEYQRIYSRIVEMCIPVQVRSEDYRKRINDNKLDKYRERLIRRGDKR